MVFDDIYVPCECDNNCGYIFLIKEAYCSEMAEKEHLVISKYCRLNKTHNIIKDNGRWLEVEEK